MEIQDPFLIQSLKEAREKASKMLDEKGELLSAPEKLKSLIERFKMPVANRSIEKLILHSIGLPPETKVGNRELRWAVLTALYAPLRQNIGSCFATAPAILIQKEQPERLLLDLYDLMMTCSLGRIFSGVENRVPICPSWGFGDLKKALNLSDRSLFKLPGFKAAFEAIALTPSQAEDLVPEREVASVETLINRVVDRQFSSLREEKKEAAKNAFKAMTDHALLKTWEYTLASFTDYKVEFYRWNLYAGLGFDAKEKDGIGEVLSRTLEQKLSDANETSEKFYQDYARAIDEIRVTEALLRQASTRDRVRQLKAELEVRSHYAQSCRDLYDNSQHLAENLSTFLKFLLDQYSQKFKEYFQEIYDPEMFDVKTELYDDSPAGFRLIYKHGRRDPSAWTFIHNGKEYAQALVSFFLAVEPMIAADCEWEGGGKVLEELTTLLIHYLQTDAFLASAIERMGKAHGKVQKGQALDNIARFEKKPWSYTSGGNMHTLLRCYYCLEKELAEEKKLIESPMDLLVFLLDLMKGLSYRVTRPYEEKPERGMLMYSPTHAFALLPGLSPFKEGWLDKGFSYTWARDHALLPGKSYYEPIRLDAETQLFLAERLHIPHFTPQSSLSISELRDELFNLLKPSISEIALADHLDAFLRSAFPLLTFPDLEKIAAYLPPDAQESFLESHPRLSTFKEAYLHLKALLSATKAKQIFEKEGLFPPMPLLFADTNWSHFFFAIGFNPGLGKLDLWRFDPISQEGYPLSVWRPYLDGSSPGHWGVLTNPREYSGHYLPDFALLKKV